MIRQPQAQRDAELLLLRRELSLLRRSVKKPRLRMWDRMILAAQAMRLPRSKWSSFLDWLIILGPGHLERVLGEYVDHYNRARPHRGLQLQPPNGAAGRPSPVGGINRRVRLGGLIHEYSRLPRAA